MVKIFHLYGVMEDIEGPDTAGDDVRGLDIYCPHKFIVLLFCEHNTQHRFLNLSFNDEMLIISCNLEFHCKQKLVLTFAMQYVTMAPTF